MLYTLHTESIIPTSKLPKRTKHFFLCSYICPQTAQTLLVGVQIHAGSEVKIATEK
jgi:hypothetical protein